MSVGYGNWEVLFVRGRQQYGEVTWFWVASVKPRLTRTHATLGNGSAYHWIHQRPHEVLNNCLQRSRGTPPSHPGGNGTKCCGYKQRTCSSLILWLRHAGARTATKYPSGCQAEKSRWGSRTGMRWIPYSFMIHLWSERLGSGCGDVTRNLWTIPTPRQSYHWPHDSRASGTVPERTITGLANPCGR